MVHCIDSLTVYYDLITFPCINMMSYLCITLIKLLFVLYYNDSFFTVPVVILMKFLYPFDMIYLLTAIGLSPGGSSTVHIYTQTIHRMIQNKQYIEQHNNFGRVRAVPCLG